MSVDTAVEIPLTAAEQKRADLIEEIEFLLSCDVGEAGILAALGNVKPLTLKRNLGRIGRHDLIPRIFEADALYHHRHAASGITARPTPRKARP